MTWRSIQETSHLPRSGYPDLISGVDTDPKAARRNRIEVLSDAESRDAPVILYHEPGDCLVKVRRKDNGFEAIPIGD